MPAEEKLKIIQDTPKKFHFKTKDNQRVDIEHKDERLFVTLFKWETEASLQIDLDAVFSTQHNFLETENRIEIENPDFLLRVYPIDTRSTGDLYGDSDDVIQCHDGGLRFELVLKKKRPAMDNSLIFPIISKNLRFSYQPFLTQEDIDAGVRRPLNVEGSYAVYHVSKKNNKYMTGKAFHIFRPIAEDALGNKAWCSLYINPETTELTITIPQQFLDEATYPITIDPDFGYSTAGATEYTIAQDSTLHRSDRAGSAWSMPAPGGTANWIKARIRGDFVCDCKVIINQKDSVAAGQHGQIAGPVENLACAAAEHWEEFTLAGEALTEAIVYILNIIGNGPDITEKGKYYIKLDTATPTTVASYYETPHATYAAPGSPWIDGPMGTTVDFSIYCNYTPPAVPPAYPLIGKPLVAPIMVGRPKIR